MFDINLSELRESLVECYQKSNTATLTTAFINLIPDKTRIPRVNIDFWLLSKFLGAMAIPKIFTRAFQNSENYRKLKNGRIRLHQVATQFIKETDPEVNSIILLFLQNQDKKDHRLIHEFYLGLIDQVIKKNGNIKLPRG